MKNIDKFKYEKYAAARFNLNETNVSWKRKIIQKLIAK
jgi:hypothetical protein